MVRVLDGNMGKYVKKQDATGLSGGLFLLDTGAVTGDDVLLVNNLLNGAGAFKVYGSNNLNDAPKTLMTCHVPAGRFGDKVSTTGKLSILL